MEDAVFIGLYLFFMLIVFTLPLSITACIAASVTRKWSKGKARRARGGIEGGEEADNLIEDSDSEHEDDFLDSEDEEFYRAKREAKRKEREEKEADWQLSTKRKFFKSWKAVWTGPAGGKAQVLAELGVKDQDERRKIAREAVREYLRLERKKARKAAGGSKTEEEAMELPSYGRAVAEGKQ